MRLLTLQIQEPLPGLVLPEMAAEHGPNEAARRYRALVVTTLRQLRGLTKARLRLSIAPADADEAVRFWLLPRLSESWQTHDHVFRSEGWEIDFGGSADEFTVHAHGEILCPYLGARWVHAALLGLDRRSHRIVGPAIGGGEYLRAHASDAPADLPLQQLPELAVVRTGDHWQEALDSALGPALKRAWEEEA